MSSINDASDVVDEVALLRRHTGKLVVSEPIHAEYRLVPLAEGEPTKDTEGGRLLRIANGMLGNGLHQCQEWHDTRDKFFEAGARFAADAHYAEAATCFRQAAAISAMLGEGTEVLTCAGYAIDSCVLCDPALAASMLVDQSRLYEANALISQAAKASRDAAAILAQSGDAAGALQNYQRAELLYRTDSRLDAERELCSEQVRHFLCVLGSYTEAAALFEEHALLRPVGLSPTNSYFLAVLAHLAHAQGVRYAVGLPRAFRKFNEFQEKDKNLRKGKERELLLQFFAAFDKMSVSMMDEAVAAYKSKAVRETTEATLDALASRCRENLCEVLLPYMS